MQLLHFLYLFALLTTFLAVFSSLVFLLAAKEFLLDEHQLVYTNCFSNSSFDLINKLTKGLIIRVLASLCLGYPKVELHCTTRTLESSLAATSIISKDYYFDYS